MNKINLPKNWNEVSLNQFIEFRNIETDTSNILYNLNLLAILTKTNIDDKIWNDLYIDELPSLLNNLTFLNELPTNDFKKEINEFKFKNIYNLTLGEFIDIDIYFTEDPIENLNKICAILYRKHKKDEWGNTIIEPYDNIDIDERSLLFDDISINDIYGVINEFNSFKHLIITSYQAIFNTVYSEDEDLDEEDLEDPEVIKEIEREKNQAKWSWEIMLHKLSNGDPTKEPELLKLPYIFILNKLSFRKNFNLD